MPTTLSNALLFFVESHIFPTKKYQCIYNINILNFIETLTNDIVNFEQPAPDIRILHSVTCRGSVMVLCPTNSYAYMEMEPQFLSLHND